MRQSRRTSFSEHLGESIFHISHQNTPDLNIVRSSFQRDEKRYLETIAACQLERDLEIFELGDETEVGEKGTACSGGQKARIALARACYSRSATLILGESLCDRSFLQLGS